MVFWCQGVRWPADTLTPKNPFDKTGPEAKVLISDEEQVLLEPVYVFGSAVPTAPKIPRDRQTSLLTHADSSYSVPGTVTLYLRSDDV